MAKPAKKSAPKKAAKKPSAPKAGAGKATPAKKADAKAPTQAQKPPPVPIAVDRGGSAPYTPKPIEGIGRPAFRYPPQ